MDRAARRWLDLHVRALDCSGANAEIELARRAWRRADTRTALPRITPKEA